MPPSPPPPLSTDEDEKGRIGNPVALGPGPWVQSAWRPFLIFLWGGTKGTPPGKLSPSREIVSGSFACPYPTVVVRRQFSGGGEGGSYRVGWSVAWGRGRGYLTTSRGGPYSVPPPLDRPGPLGSVHAAAITVQWEAAQRFVPTAPPPPRDAPSRCISLVVDISCNLEHSIRQFLCQRRKQKLLPQKT